MKRALAWTASMALLASAQLARANEEINGTWLIEKPVFALKTAEGAQPPLKPAAAKVYKARQAARAKGDTSFDSATWCSSLGMPRMMLVNYPFEVIVRPKHVAFLHQWDWWARVVYMPGAYDPKAVPPPPPGIEGGPAGGPPGGPPPGAGGAAPGDAPFGAPPPGPPPRSGPPGMGDPTVMENVPTGFSQGRWEGNVLVVTTDHLVDRTLLDSAGMPHSGNLKLTERIRLIAPDRLENRIRIEDPATFSKPWETVLTYKRQASMPRDEDVCLDRLQNGEPAVREAK